MHCRAVDSTGIRAEGEGEWNARKQGGAKHRIWRKIHIGIDEETLEVRAAEVTSSNIGDAPIPPRKNAKPWKPTNPGAIARNAALRASKYLGRAIWRRWSGYHRWSRVESKMTCIKLLGQTLMPRDFDRQVAELQVHIAVLNGYTALGIPVTVAIG